MSQELVVATSQAMALWAALAFTAVLLKQKWAAIPAPSAFMTAMVAVALFAGIFFFPPLFSTSAIGARFFWLWLFLAPWISFALVATGMNSAMRRNQASAGTPAKRESLLLHCFVTVLILFNSYWLVKLDAVAG
jgi:hypothetical protein